MTRYDCTYGYEGEPIMEVDPEGEYVLFGDIADALAERDELKATMELIEKGDDAMNRLILERNELKVRLDSEMKSVDELSLHSQDLAKENQDLRGELAASQDAALDLTERHRKQCLRMDGFIRRACEILGPKANYLEYLRNDLEVFKLLRDLSAEEKP